MAKPLNDAQGEGAAQNARRWFVPALAGVVLLGVVLIVLVRSLNGPAKPLLDPTTAIQDRMRFEQAMGLLEQGRKLLETGKHKEAMGLAEQALALRPDMVRAHLAVAQIALQMRDYNRAEQEFQAILAREPEDEESLFNLAAIAAVRKDYESARKQFAHALTKVDRRMASQALPLIVLQAAANMDQPAVAARHMTDAIQQDHGRGEVLLEAKIYGPDVIALLAERVEQQEPADGSAQAAAAASYALAAKDTPGNLLKAQRAARATELYLSAGKPSLALQQVRVALEAEPSNPQWIVLRDRVAVASSQPSSASQPAIRTSEFGL